MKSISFNFNLIFLIFFCFTLSACSPRSDGGGSGSGRGAGSKDDRKKGGRSKNEKEKDKNGKEDPNSDNKIPSGKKQGVTCLLNQGVICTEFVGESWDANSLSEVCREYQGVLYEGACSNQNIVYSCLLNKGTGEDVIVRYYSPVTPGQAQEDCKSAGGQQTHSVF